MARVRIRLVVFALALLATVSRAMVPGGWMPSASANGAPIFAMCSEGSAATGWVGTDGTLHKQGEGDRDDDDDIDCAFSTATAATLAVPYHPPAPAARAEAAVLRFTASTPGHGLAAPPPLATGPPAPIPG